ETPRLHALAEATAEKTNRKKQAILDEWTSTIPAQRFAEPEETAAAVAFLCSPAAAYINGINLPVDGGRLMTL
ncbi:MAG: SDR family oxidoreductase, partial [Calditrichaeota bacterium]|nr:SDR family oxidoreductase [Calditrichota bacterium]